MKGLNKYLAIALTLASVCSCKSKQAVASQDNNNQVQTLPLPPGAVRVEVVPPTSYALPNATLIKINPDYENKVGVTLNSDGTLAYYPAPTDLHANSSPYYLKDDWYLNRQGIGANSVFTNWTFEEYRALPAVPSTEEIIANIIPGSGVIQLISTPIKIGNALADPDICEQYVP